MGKSRRSTHKRLEEMKRLALLDPELILDEDAIFMLQPARRKYTRRPKYDLPPDDRHTTTDISEVIEIKQGAGPGRKRQKKQEDIFDSNDCNDSNEPTPEEIKEQKASVERKRKVDLKYQWYNVLKTLCTSYLIFVGKQGGLPSTEIDSPVAFDCQCSEKVLLTKTVRMYFFHAIKDVSVCYCSCKPLAEALMLMGMFPSSPSSPKSAIHLGLLGFFNEVRNTLKSSSEGIAKLYNNLRGNPVQSCLSANICRNVLYMYNRLLLAADKEVNQRTDLKDLAMCCPACPSRDSNHPMDRIFITMDGCFSMKCKSKASLLDELFTIDTVENAWVKPESVELYKKEKPPKDALLNENSFRAAGNGASYKSKLYPVKGLFAASCARHDLTLKMVDMDSGEGFKYPLSVLHDLFQEDKDSIKTPVNLMYDIICVLEKSLTTHFPYLTANGTLALPVFHAYAHVISCQSSFNPKNIESYGRTDGEASERLWSSLRPFVTITRPMSQANRRLTLTLAIRHRNMEKKWGMASVLYGKYKSTKKILAAGLVKLKGVNQEEISLAWERHLALTRSGKSCSKIWSDLPPSLGSVTRFYLLESILFRFRVKMYENSTGTSNAAIDRLDGVLTVSASDGSIKVAGETFFMQQIKDIEKKQEKVLDEIRQTIPNFVPHAYADLSAETAQLSLGLWEDFVQRKKLLFKDAMRANLQAYKFTTNLMFKSGHIGKS
ncbi:uncharacterized protein EV154DRAFT_525077 [Mucor mucedo]|uniref:uncharacterized protein n=1 Tax=Mucor mucedo TaxID=29922 RepID=UPI0022201433|nr:uncharacterized protein EV154DRAFT_525077 [Mucor mucedo]KAI7878379.1 hypothetical protein EV154DRAFT_525077 [Mucor mucedo]